MTNIPKRPRGRPKGSEIDDGVLLSQIADLLVESEAQNVAAAVRRIAGHDPSLIRRLQRKFKRDRSTLLAQAHAKAAQASAERETWIDEIQRVTRPLDWRQTKDPTMRVLDALERERQERLAKHHPDTSA